MGNFILKINILIKYYKEAVLKQFRKDSSFEKLDLNLIYPTTHDGVQLILKENLMEQSIICENDNNNYKNNTPARSNISFYHKNLILKDFVRDNNSSFSDESNTEREDISRSSNTSTEAH
jgi:hypothetical protein